MNELKKGGTMKKITIETSSDFIFVRGIRKCIAQTARDFGFNKQDSYHIETVVDELCNNAIEHGCKTNDEKIIVECWFSPEEMKLKVKDGGKQKFDMEKVLELNNELKGVVEKNRRGRGLLMVKQLVDELSVKSNKDGKEVIIQKKKN